MESELAIPSRLRHPGRNPLGMSSVPSLSVLQTNRQKKEIMETTPLLSMAGKGGRKQPPSGDQNVRSPTDKYSSAGKFPPRFLQRGGDQVVHFWLAWAI